jgi:hypothetical protein
MAIQWMTPGDLTSALLGGEIINESGSGLEWMTPSGTFVNEAAAAGASGFFYVPQLSGSLSQLSGGLG